MSGLGPGYCDQLAPWMATPNRSTDLCPHCGGEMRFLAVIEAPLVIERILRHLGLWEPRPPSQGPPEDNDWPVNGQIPLTYEPLPAIT